MDCCQNKTNRWIALKNKLHLNVDEPKIIDSNLPKFVLIGTPNVGKSVLFNSLTGAYVTVSNYPGTTVEVSRGKIRLGSETWEVVDTPGLYSLMPITEEERVTRTLLLQEQPTVILHVIDAKNIERMLNFTLQLIEAELPVILVVNLMDEAEKLGLNINQQQLQTRLGIPVVTAAGVLGRGLDTLKAAIINYHQERKLGRQVHQCGHCA